MNMDLAMVFVYGMLGTGLLILMGVLALEIVQVTQARRKK